MKKPAQPATPATSAALQVGVCAYCGKDGPLVDDDCPDCRVWADEFLRLMRSGLSWEQAHKAVQALQEPQEPADDPPAPATPAARPVRIPYAIPSYSYPHRCAWILDEWEEELDRLRAWGVPESHVKVIEAKARRIGAETTKSAYDALQALVEDYGRRL